MKIEETIQVALPAADVWRVAGDPASIASWLPGLDSSTMDENVRTATWAGDGGSARERILQRDDQARFYEYEYIDGPLPLSDFVSRLSVDPTAEGCMVTWTAEFSAATSEEEQQLADMVAGLYRQGLEGLRSLLVAN